MSTSAGRVLIIPQGTYDAQTTYNMLDLVRYGKGTFLCKKTSTGNAPSFEGDTEYWQLLVISGDVSGVKGNAESEYREGNVNITYDNLGGVDATLSSSSTLPIQNKAVKTALDLKLDDPGYDTVPTAYSDKLLTSGSIKTALDAKLSSNGDTKDNVVTFTSFDDAATTEKTNAGMTTGGRNYCPNNITNETVDGLTFVKNVNGTISIDGTATGSGTKTISVFTLEAGSYVITDGENEGLVEIVATSDSSAIADTTSANQEFTLANNTGVTVRINYTSGDEFDVLVVSPMIRLSTDTDTDFEPYYEVAPAILTGDSHKSLFKKISAMLNNVRKLWNTVGHTTAGIAKIIGDTTVTFTDSAIQTTSELHLLSENSSNTPIFYTAVSVSNGTVTYTIPALTEATTFYLQVKN